MRAKPEQAQISNMTVEDTVRAVLRDVLAIEQDRVDAFDHDTPLFGALPELDSMAVAGLLTEMEDRLRILIEDDDIDGETFETFGSLVDFAKSKVRV
jgi:acyl carrier protein